jgi:multiple sugar transport system substrate-binding protein
MALSDANTVVLRGMAWNHVRGYGPMLALSEQFHKTHPRVSIVWDKRSLKDFGDVPVPQLAERYDLLLIDHPHVGLCADRQALVPLDDWIPETWLREQRKHSVGPSHESYCWNGRQWALAVDAAAQVASCRPELMAPHPWPRTWNEVMELSRSLPAGRKVGWPLCPTDAMCSFLTLCAGGGTKNWFDETHGIAPDVGQSALELMFSFVPVLHPASLESNPIRMYDMMAQSDEIAYVPLAFGYSNYAREGFARARLRFGNIPSVSGIPEGSLLGGVGLAVSARTKQVPLAVDFAMLAAGGDTQRTVYFDAGGQPGHLSAWRDERVNRESGGFFRDTLPTLELSFMRPRIPCFPAFQEQLGDRLHEALLRKFRGQTADAAAIMADLNRLYRNVRRSYEA